MPPRRFTALFPFREIRKNTTPHKTTTTTKRQASTTQHAPNTHCNTAGTVTHLHGDGVAVDG